MERGRMELPDEWELIAFFESDPDPTDRDETEFFGSVGFTRDVGGGEVLQWSASVKRIARTRLAKKPPTACARSGGPTRGGRSGGARSIVYPIE